MHINLYELIYQLKDIDHYDDALNQVQYENCLLTYMGIEDNQVCGKLVRPGKYEYQPMIRYIFDNYFPHEVYVYINL